MSGIWRRFRGWPLWGQIVAWVVVAFIVLGAIGSATGSGNKKTAVSTAATTTTTTSKPTTTTTTTTAPTTTTDPLQAVRTISAGDCDRLTSADVTADSGVYTARATEGLTADSTKDHARDCVSNILRNVKAAGVPPGWTEVNVVITFDLKNQYGEVSKDATVISAIFPVDTVTRIQYDNIDTTKILTFASSKTVHPSFARGDGT